MLLSYMTYVYVYAYIIMVMHSFPLKRKQNHCQNSRTALDLKVIFINKQHAYIINTMSVRLPI